jgi:anti-sigma B factor antagonist
MNITITKEGDISILSLTGSLDTNTSKGAENEMNKLIEEGRTKLLIDLSNLDYISSSGLRILLSTSKKLKPIGGEMRISGLNETVNEVFEISGFTMIFNVFKTLEEAKTNF